VSCPSVSLCVAVDSAGNVVTSTNPIGGRRAWTVTRVDRRIALNAVSCPSVSLCVAVDGAGNVVTSKRPMGGRRWWRLATVDRVEVLSGVSCASESQCVAVGDGANDLPMLGAVGLSIAYRAKPAVQAQAMLSIVDGGLDRALEILQP